MLRKISLAFLLVQCYTFAVRIRELTIESAENGVVA